MWTSGLQTKKLRSRPGYSQCSGAVPGVTIAPVIAVSAASMKACHLGLVLDDEHDHRGLALHLVAVVGAGPAGQQRVMAVELLPVARRPAGSVELEQHVEAVRRRGHRQRELDGRVGRDRLELLEREIADAPAPSERDVLGAQRQTFPALPPGRRVHTRGAGAPPASNEVLPRESLEDEQPGGDVQVVDHPPGILDLGLLPAGVGIDVRAARPAVLLQQLEALPRQHEDAVHLATTPGRDLEAHRPAGLEQLRAAAALRAAAGLGPEAPDELRAQHEAQLVQGAKGLELTVTYDRFGHLSRARRPDAVALDRLIHQSRLRAPRAPHARADR